MVLDEVLRNQIDMVLRRQKASDLLDALSRGLFAACVTFACVRVLLGLLTGGQGGFIALLAAPAAGVTFILTTPRRKHTRLTAARYIDKQLKLQDRIATAVEHATLDHAARNRVEAWLFMDAANHTHLIDPVALVPLRSPAYARWSLPLLGLCVLLTLIPYPQGFTWQLGGSQLQHISKRADELLALADQLERIDPQNPHLGQLAHELRRVGELIREKQLPHSQANQLLRQLEQELQQSGDGGNIAGNSLGLDLARVQELTQSIRSINSGMYSQLSPQEQVALSQAQRNTTDADGYPGANRGTRGDDRQPEAHAGASGNAEENESDVGSTGSGSQPGDTGKQGSEEAGAGEDGFDPYGDFGLAGASDDFDDEMGYGAEGGSMAGTEGGSQGTTDYERQSDLNPGTERLSGQITDSGQYYSSPTSTTSIPGNQLRSPTADSSFFSLPGGVENAIQQENIPSAYQRWIRDYFTKIEPGADR